MHPNSITTALDSLIQREDASICRPATGGAGVREGGARYTGSAHKHLLGDGKALAQRAWSGEGSADESFLE